jgi:DNA-binding GntR family transcriptional regulator
VTKRQSLRASGLRGDVSDRAYRDLREGILGGTIGPGQRLVELAVCEWLNISRTPARDALRRLRSDGLVEPAAGGGMQVVRHDANALHELYVAREVLEGTAAAEAAKNATDAELRALDDSIKLQRGMAGDVDAFAQENKAFHARLYAAAHNRFLVRMSQTLHDSVSLLGPTAINTPEWVRRAIAQHREIADAIGKRDAVKAEAAMRAHIRSGFERRVAALKG